MRVRVRLGAGLARLAAAPALTIDLPDGATVADAIAHVGGSRPELAGALPAALPVVRGEHADRSLTLSPGDEVALITPISGG
jgi:molybdopterin converting factor small subunit